MDEQKAPEALAKPKRQRKAQEAIIVAPEPEVRLGSLAISNPDELVRRGAELATALAEIIHKQELFSIIRNKKGGQPKKYVKCEGWTTMGAMLGVVPVEDYCRRLENAKGFEAKVNLIRTRDGSLVGSASAECTYDETNWNGKDSYSLRSMALTRATSKAFRLSFSWIIKLAGFEATPAEEMVAQEDATITRQAVEEEVERQKGEHSAKTPQNGSNSVQCLFWCAPDKFNGHRAIFLNLKEFGAGLNEVAAEGLRQVLKKYLKGDDQNGELWVPTGKKEGGMDLLIAELENCGVHTKQLQAARA
jgi:hypothetical protein